MLVKLTLLTRLFQIVYGTGGGIDDSIADTSIQSNLTDDESKKEVERIKEVKRIIEMTDTAIFDFRSGRYLSEK